MKQRRKIWLTLALTTSMVSSVILSGCDFAEKPQDTSEPTLQEPAELTLLDKAIERLKTPTYQSIVVEGEQDYTGTDFGEMVLTVNPLAEDMEYCGDIRNYSIEETRYNRLVYIVRDLDHYYSASFSETNEANAYPDFSELIYQKPWEWATLEEFVEGFIPPVLNENNLYNKYIKHVLEVLGFDVKESSLGANAQTALNFANAALLEIADAAEGIVEEENTLKIDVIQTASALLADAKSVIAKTTGDTTLQEFLLYPEVKKYMESLTRNMDLKETQAKLMKVYQDISADFVDTFSADAFVKVLRLISIQPDAQSTPYEYLVKIFSSEEFAAVSEDFFGTDVICGKSKMSVLFSSFDSFKSEAEQMVNGFTVKENSIECPSPWNQDSLFTHQFADSKAFTYTLREDHSIESLTLCKVTYGDPYNQYYLQGKMTLQTEEAKMEDVTDFSVEGAIFGFEDGQSKYSVSIPNYKPNSELNCYPIFQNDTVVDFFVTEYSNGYDEETDESWWTETPLTSSYDPQTSILTVQGERWDEQKGKYVAAELQYPVSFNELENSVLVNISGKDGWTWCCQISYNKICTMGSLLTNK